MSLCVWDTKSYESLLMSRKNFPKFFKPTYFFLGNALSTNGISDFLQVRMNVTLIFLENLNSKQADPMEWKLFRNGSFRSMRVEHSRYRNYM